MGLTCVTRGGGGSGVCDVTPPPLKKNKKMQHRRPAGDKSRAFEHQKLRNNWTKHDSVYFANIFLFGVVFENTNPPEAAGPHIQSILGNPKFPPENTFSTLVLTARSHVKDD